MIGSFVKSKTGVNFAGKCSWLMYMICLIHCFPFFSVIATLFDVASCIFKLKDFNCPNSFVPLPFNKHRLGQSLTSYMKIVKRCIFNNIFDNITILMRLLTHFEFVSVSSHYIATYDTHSFLLLYPNFHVFLYN